MALDPYTGLDDDEIDPYVAWASQADAPVLPTPSMPPPMVAPPAPATEEGPIEALPAIVDDPAPVAPVAPAPAPLEVDAVSAAAPAPTVADMTSVTYEQPAQPTFDSPNAYLEHMTALANEQPLPSMREAQIGDATETAVRAMTPEQFLDYKTKRDATLLAKKAELEHQAAMQSEQRARENLEVQRAAIERAQADSKDLMAQAAKIASTKVNPDRYMQNRGLGGTIRDMTGLFLMGLGGNVEGGLRVLEGRIQRDIDAQNADIQNAWQGINAKRGAIADELARHGDLYRAQETYRIAAYQSQINDIDTQLQLYDPAGSTAIRGREARDALQAAMQASLMAFNQKQFDNHQKALDTAMKVRAQQLNEAKFDADQRAKAAKLGKPVKPDDIVQPPEYFEAMYGKRPPVAMSQNGYEQWAKTGKIVEDYSKAQRENSPADISRQLAVGGITDDQGNPIDFRSTEYAGKLAKSKGSADNAVRLIDKIIAARTEHGWESNWVNGAAKREMAGDFASLQLEKKNTDELGVLAGPDMDLINRSIGTSDPSEWRDSVLPALKNARSNIIEQLNKKVEAEAVLPKGRKLKRWDPPSTADIPRAQPLVQGKTSAEQAEGAKLGRVGQMFSFTTNEDRAQKAENAAKVGPTGLDADDDKRIVAAITQAAKGGTAGVNALERLADAASAPRESVASGVLARIRAESPEVYAKVLAQLPPERKAAVEQVDREAAAGLFGTMTVEQIVGSVGTDAPLRSTVADKAINGTAAEKAKALEVLQRVQGGAR